MGERSASNPAPNFSKRVADGLKAIASGTGASAVLLQFAAGALANDAAFACGAGAWPALNGQMFGRIREEQMRQTVNAQASGEVAARGPSSPGPQ